MRHDAGRAGGGGRGPDAHDSTGAAAGAAAPGQDLPLPGLQCPDRRGASRAPLGPRAARPSCRTSRCSAAGIIARCTRRATSSSDYPTARSSSDGRMAGALPDVPAPPAVPADPAGAIRAQNAGAGAHASCAHAGSPSGSESGWTCAGRSTCCIRAPRIAKPRRRAHVHAHNGESARAPRARYGTRSSFRNRSSSWLRHVGPLADLLVDLARVLLDRPARGRAKTRRSWARFPCPPGWWTNGAATLSRASSRTLLSTCLIPVARVATSVRPAPSLGGSRTRRRPRPRRGGISGRNRRVEDAARVVEAHARAPRR